MSEKLTREQFDQVKENLPSLIIEGLRRCTTYETYIAFVESQGIPSRNTYSAMIGHYDFNNVHALAFSQHGSFALTCFLHNQGLDPQTISREEIQKVIPEFLVGHPDSEAYQKLLAAMRYFDEQKAKSPLADASLSDCLDRAAKREPVAADFLFNGVKELILSRGYTYEDVAG